MSLVPRLGFLLSRAEQYAQSHATNVRVSNGTQTAANSFKPASRTFQAPIAEPKPPLPSSPNVMMPLLKMV